ncbi:MAG: flagellar filament capping protein FliD [Sulfurimonas sp.]|nr:flagellar filament capping protein FliD [Sulfurimonas sp.]
MGISSLGVGSNILTQDVLDQLRAADEAKFVTPITTKITAETKKEDALEVIDASMKNFIDSITAVGTQALYDERKATVVGTSATVTAASNSDIQDFTINVTKLATKQIEQSGSFASDTDSVSATDGQINLNIDGQDFTIDYVAGTTLKELKDLINDVAGDKVDATVVQIGATDFRLFISSADTGTTQNITITDSTGTIDARLTTGLTAIQTGVDANFTFNGQAIIRTSNNITDLVTGLDITLKEVGTSTVSVAQNQDNVIAKIDSFVEKYNTAITELNKATKTSKDLADRGAFSAESTIKNMKQAIEDMFASVGGGVGSLSDYGFDIDKDGKMSVNKTTLEAKMDADMDNVQAFFSGGTFTKADLSTVTLTGAFVEMSTIVKRYTDSGETLDGLSDSISESVTDLNERKTKAMERLDARYEILKKQYAAYDLMISKFNSASSMFTEMANAQAAS